MKQVFFYEPADGQAREIARLPPGVGNELLGRHDELAVQHIRGIGLRGGVEHQQCAEQDEPQGQQAFPAVIVLDPVQQLFGGQENQQSQQAANDYILGCMDAQVIAGKEHQQHGHKEKSGQAAAGGFGLRGQHPGGSAQFPEKQHKPAPEGAGPGGMAAGKGIAGGLLHRDQPGIPDKGPVDAGCGLGQEKHRAGQYVGKEQQPAPALVHTPKQCCNQCGLQQALAPGGDEGEKRIGKPSREAAQILEKQQISNIQWNHPFLIYRLMYISS